MKDTLKGESGFGLAAPQIGKSIKLCLAKFNGKTNVLINPEITWRSEETDEMEEGCLSLPKFTAMIVRPVSVAFAYYDEKLLEKELKLEGFPARIVQHEIDHLNNILLKDYARIS